MKYLTLILIVIIFAGCQQRQFVETEDTALDLTQEVMKDSPPYADGYKSRKCSGLWPFIGTASKTHYNSNGKVEKEASQTLVLFGVLYGELQARRLYGKEYKHKHTYQILWGAFGFKKKHGKNYIKFLWIPIPIGS